MTSHTILNGIAVPEVAATAVAAACMTASETVPSVPSRNLNVLTLAAEEVQVPQAVIRKRVPATSRLAGIAGVLSRTVSVVLIAADAATEAAERLEPEISMLAVASNETLFIVRGVCKAAAVAELPVQLAALPLVFWLRVGNEVSAAALPLGAR